MRRTLVAAMAATLLLAACTGDAEEAEDSSSVAGQTTTAGDDGGTDDGDDAGTDDDGDEPVEDAPAVEAPFVDAEVRLQDLGTFDQPIDLVPRSGTTDLYLAQRGGLILRAEVRGEGVDQVLQADSTPVLDLTEQVSTDGERGLLGIEFSSDGRQLYVSYTDVDGTSVLVEYGMTSRDRADTETARELLRVPQPRSNHNGGQVRVGPDGFLYWGLGDGGGSGDPDGNGQDPGTLLGSMIRIDPFPVGEQPYGIPAGNPFSPEGDRADEGAPEVFAWGLRNPWRFDFDPLTGDLWIGDVGQDAVEEIDWLPASAGNGVGANLGWNEVEGDRAFDGGTPPADHVAPLVTYTHDDGCSVTGGVVYRGEAVPDWDGVYLFGDFCSGEIWGVTPGEGGPVQASLPISGGRSVLWAFGRDAVGEVYLLRADGLIQKVMPPEPDPETEE